MTSENRQVMTMRTTSHACMVLSMSQPSHCEAQAGWHALLPFLHLTSERSTVQRYSLLVRCSPDDEGTGDDIHDA